MREIRFLRSVTSKKLALARQKRLKRLFCQKIQKILKHQKDFGFFVKRHKKYAKIPR
ncbi:MAG: hypothetical protein MSS71_07075 [Campylobacter sp.]|nr:hypothetical protein [Campylobacter sp.]